MTATLSRAEELKNDLNNISFTIKHLFGVLSELEWDGASNSAEYRRIQKNIEILKKNKQYSWYFNINFIRIWRINNVYR